ncbi:hypothetical protein NB703_003911 [Pantoea ananatis]|uniref:Uncharacterized protein n=1 Tax=Pantoea ananas TaxID=553 RepID=A0AAJ1D239_PANAN|nr:hypothetical protein [Pantoea ananatis]
MRSAGQLRFITQRFGFSLQRTAVKLAKLHLVFVNRLNEPGSVDVVGGQGFPFAFMFGDVHHNGVGVNLRIEVARGVMREQRGHHLAGRFDAGNAVSGIPHAYQVFNHPQRLFHRLVVCLQQAFVASGQYQHGDAFRGGKRQVMSRTVDVRALHLFAQLRSVGELAVQHVRKRLQVNLAFQAQLARALTQPLTFQVIEKIVVIFAAVVTGSIGGRRHRRNGHHRS